MMLFQTVVVPTTILAAHSSRVLNDNFATSNPDNRFVSHAAQRQFMANLYIAGSGLLNSWQTIETTQSVQKEQQAQHTTLFRWFEQSKSAPVAAPVPVAAATTVPTRIHVRSHPTQSNLVQRFASIFTPLSMSTSFATCEAEKEEPKKAPEPTLGRWFN